MTSGTIAPDAPRMKADGPSVQDLLAREARAVPEPLRRSSSVALDPGPIAKERYTSQSFADAEFARLWSRTWQMACREEDIPETGDYEVYEIGSVSLIVMRVAPDDIRAYYNACLHRGRALKDCSGSAVNLRCPFHGFTWNLDGSVKRLTNAWDFEHVDPEAFRLPQARTARWGGFVFVNLSDKAESLESYLEDLPDVYRTRGWALGDRVKTVFVAKRHACNWKVALEAFIESFHVVATHPGAMPYLGDAFTQYDVWPDRRHYTRMISPRGMHSPHIGPLSDTQVYRAGLRPSLGDKAETAELPPGKTPREAMGDMRRAALRPLLGETALELTDCEVLDTIQYHIFPNLVCWAGWGSFLVYRFRPDGTAHDRCIMEVMFLTPKTPGKPAPPVARAAQMLELGQSHHDAPQLGGFAAVFDEDASNLFAIQKGLMSMKGPGITTGNYQEMRIRHFHRMIDSYLERPLP
jgi:nitrite reductase/ring-hydroxylating ferredoxin subunit